jgi:hypothetical protein
MFTLCLSSLLPCSRQKTNHIWCRRETEFLNSCCWFVPTIFCLYRFESVYMDEKIRVAKDIRGNYLVVCRDPSSFKTWTTTDFKFLVRKFKAHYPALLELKLCEYNWLHNIVYLHGSFFSSTNTLVSTLASVFSLTFNNLCNSFVTIVPRGFFIQCVEYWTMSKKSSPN